MKILNVYFKNINSLEGENRIDFDLAPLADAGVFAITGPNGSGKTSILDAITLGLYGQTFKFDRPSAHVMTKHTTDCFAEVVFSAGEKQFRSSWRVNRKQGLVEGEVLPPQMQLLELNGSETLLADQPNKVRDKLAELTGLDFRGFTRSMMLAQGHFAAFLNALDNERLDILEKIISSDIYADFKKEIQGKAEQAKVEVQEIEKKIAAVPIIDSEKQAAMEEDLADFKDQYEQHRKVKNKLTQQLSWLNNIRAIENKIVTLQKSEQAALSRLESAQADLKNIEENQGVLDFQADVQAIDAKATDIKQHQSKEQNIQNDARALQTRLKNLPVDDSEPLLGSGKSVNGQKQAIEKINRELLHLKTEKQSALAVLPTLDAQLQAKKTEFETVSVWLQEHQAEFFLLDDFPQLGQLHNLRVELKTLHVKNKNYVQWSQTTTSTLEKNKVDIEKRDNNITRSKEKLRQYQNELVDIAQDKTLEEIKELYNSQQERLQLFKDMLSLAQANKKQSSRGMLKTMLAKPDLVSEAIDAELNSLAEQIVTDKNILRALEKAVVNEKLIKKYKVERVLLVDNEPCPLCGALHHPFADKAPRFSNSSQALIDQQAKLQTAQTKIETLTQQRKLARQQEHKKEQQQTNLLQLRSQWMGLCNRLNVVSEEMTIKNIRLMKKMYKSEIAEFNLIAEMQKKYVRQENRIKKTVEQIKNREELQVELNSSNQKLDKEWQERPQESKDLEKKIEELETELTTISEHITEQLNGLGMKLPKLGKEDALFDKLNIRRQDYQTYHVRAEGLSAEVEQLTEDAAAGRDKIDQLGKTIKQYANQLQQEQRVILHLQLEEKQTLFANEQKLTSPLEEEKTLLQQQLQEKIAVINVQTLAELREILALVLSKDQLQLKQKQLHVDIEKLVADQRRAEAQLQTERALKVTELSQQELELEQRGIDEKMDISRHEMNALEQSKREIKTLQLERQGLTKQLLQIQENFQQCEKDVLQISTENGMHFRRKVQKIMADKLLVVANGFLEKISGRYYLHQSESQQGFALEIEDTYRNNVRRLPKTLSGGESFVISLALALALSELANNGQSLDSLFLDEGFGNLDEEALYLVVSTLKNLKQHGKMVGVISHVSGVRERISTQIEMSRNPNGSSGFAVVS